MILVTGAAGKTGKAVVAALAAKGIGVRALVRNLDHAGSLTALGAAEVSIGSFEDHHALALAAAGAQAIYHICPNVSAGEVAYAKAIVAAARDQGVRRFVYHSVLHPQIEAMPHHFAKLRVEEMLFTAGFDLTVLQPTAYMQNILGAWSAIVDQVAFRNPYPVETRLSLVDLDDVGEVAALVLTQEGHSRATYELVGTEPLSQTDVAAAIGAALGRSVRAETETVAAWDLLAGAAGMGEHERTKLAAMFRYYAEYGLVGNPNTLRWLLGRAPNDLTRFLRRVVAQSNA
jgi:NAD(P)H dehydrogenase (quinone)